MSMKTKQTRLSPKMFGVDFYAHVTFFIFLLQVNAFRSMMVGAFSHSTAVGKLRQDLPDVPVDARVNFPRYSLDEAATVCHYYLRFAYAFHQVSKYHEFRFFFCIENL